MAKRHHYVPVTYLKNFADISGNLLVYRKDEPDRAFRQKPEATGFERYYYSQYADDGTRDDDRFEALFSEIETPWPTIVNALSSRRTMFDTASHLIVFLALMRVRGPAFRDAAELHLAEAVHVRTLAEHAAGRLPPLPKGHEDLIDKLQVIIDPHQSLIAMAKSMKDIGRMFAKLSFDVLHNTTPTPYLTSDNPVIYFDPGVRPQRLMPYAIRPKGGRVELLFPVSSSMVLRGRGLPHRADIGHRTISDPKRVEQINRLISRFAYRTVFATGREHDALIAKYAAVSPVVRFDRILKPDGGYYSFAQSVFGPRPDKPKWEARDPC